MGRVILQMMISVDGMVSGPNGELDWIANDKELLQDHAARVEQADTIILGAGAGPEMSGFWKAAEHDESADSATRQTGRAMNKAAKIIYSHKDRAVDWNNAVVRVVADDKALVEDIERLKRDTKGTILSFGGVRFARTLLQQELVDGIHLDICPIVLGKGQPLFTDLTHRTSLRLLETERYNSGATMVEFEVVKSA